jgi:hypothetical protein
MIRGRFCLLNDICKNIHPKVLTSENIFLSLWGQTLTVHLKLKNMATYYRIDE